MFLAQTARQQDEISHENTVNHLESEYYSTQQEQDYSVDKEINFLHEDGTDETNSQSNKEELTQFRAEQILERGCLVASLLVIRRSLVRPLRGLTCRRWFRAGRHRHSGPLLLERDHSMLQPTAKDCFGDRTVAEDCRYCLRKALIWHWSYSADIPLNKAKRGLHSALWLVSTMGISFFT